MPRSLLPQRTRSRILLVIYVYIIVRFIRCCEIGRVDSIATLSRLALDYFLTEDVYVSGG